MKQPLDVIHDLDERRQHAVLWRNYFFYLFAFTWLLWVVTLWRCHACKC